MVVQICDRVLICDYEADESVYYPSTCKCKKVVAYSYLVDSCLLEQNMTR